LIKIIIKLKNHKIMAKSKSKIKDPKITINELAVMVNDGFNGKMEYMKKTFATKESSMEMLKLGAEILQEIKSLKREKDIGDAQDKRKTKVLEIHNSALKRNKILSPEETLQIDQMGAF